MARSGPSARTASVAVARMDHGCKFHYRTTGFVELVELVVDMNLCAWDQSLCAKAEFARSDSFLTLLLSMFIVRCRCYYRARDFARVG